VLDEFYKKELSSKVIVLEADSIESFVAAKEADCSWFHGCNRSD
jgi:hypothetical protein